MTSLASIADYEAATQTTVAPASALEAAIQFALDAASDDIRTYTDQLFDYVTDDVIVLDGTGRTGLLLPEQPVVQINSVTIDKGLTTELVVTDWVLGFGGVLRRRGTQVDPNWWYQRTPPKTWPWGFSNITIDYDHGFGAYEGEQLPSNLINVAIQQARSIVSALPSGITSETISGYSYTRSLGSEEGVDRFSKVLDRFKLPRVPVP